MSAARSADPLVKREAAQAPPDPLEHQGLVRHVAMGYVGRGVDMEDLVSAGQIGLIAACRRFDDSLGYQFSTFATFCIRNEVIRELRQNGMAVRIPADHWALFDRRENHAVFLTARKQAVLTHSVALVSAVANRTSEDLGEIPDREHTEPDSEAPARIEELLDCLTPRERQVIQARFGLGDLRGWTRTLRDVGDEIGISRERVRQLEHSALRRMRQHAIKQRAAS